MAQRYTYATTISFDGAEPFDELDVEVSFTVAWGSPESGRFGPPEHYDPGSADEVEDIRVEKVNGQPRPWGLTAETSGEGSHLASFSDEAVERTVLAALEDEDERAAMVASAIDDDVAAADAHAEAQWEERRLEGWSDV